ncbi:aminodeoxychorismate lyase [Paucilactobacillus hokkaidonensis JCM 18461]|uniref:Endolytic murein transglycosylase n=1 Tax=Paucilactobacillus hokkaidonensis JCM 18461 TaxID=1291742 RepID=A0A0A1GX46_9LACO|nr:endolytic transglycosylase MltG [Paucilactobacillus hokkaidonensis]BAP85464.1 aminodeoxychorismate lyase [Paucilactobacillus hokkaidonensis JCM 18461]
MNNSEDQAKKKKRQKKYWWIVAVVVIIIGLLGGAKYYFDSAMQPVNPDSSKTVQVKIPLGATNKKISQILEDKHLVKSAFVFNYYTQTQKNTEFKAGYYSLRSSMNVKTIIKILKQGGSTTSVSGLKGKVLIQEGQTIDQIATTVQKQTKYSSKEFLKLMQNDSYLDSLAKKYPKLLTSAMSAQDVRYRLEGYLFPATYDVSNLKSLKSLVNEMVAAENEQMKPYYQKITAKHLSVQEVLTLASLVEREGVSNSDRKKIAGVFFNRITAKMPLQSDISVMYALNTHKKSLTYKDLKVDSPYNLYTNQGYGPGPFNSPGIQSIKAVLNPSSQSKDYLYFVANMKTGKVYYSKTYAQHQKVTAKLSKDNK